MQVKIGRRDFNVNIEKDTKNPPQDLARALLYSLSCGDTLSGYAKSVVQRALALDGKKEGS